MMEFYFLNISFIILTAYIILKKEYKLPTFLFYWGIIIIYLAPSHYIFWGGESYKHFGTESSELFYLLGALYTLVLLMFFILLNSNIKTSLLMKSPESISALKATNIIFLSCLFIYLFYILLYWNSWPLINAIVGKIIQRPDIVKGDFKFYFTVTTFSNIIFPFCFFSYISREKKKTTITIFLFLICILSLSLGGNKGLFLYFIVFCMFFANEIKIKIRYIILAPLLGLIFYSLMKGVTPSIDNIYNYLLESIIRRIFITQGMSGPNAIQLYLDGMDFYNLSSQQIKELIFQYVYGYSPGSMPVPYFVEFYLKFGLFIAITLTLIIFSIISLFFLFFRNCSTSYKWLVFYTSYIIVMSGFSPDNYLRFFAIIIFISIHNMLMALLPLKNKSH
ncbi:TPA: oligosaccharide repeat unit polymerase [Morganella morganii subsp. morganii]|nr:oligosaccharide repeat unit polymerase [Morganella morganii subsp. morganii]